MARLLGLFLLLALAVLVPFLIWGAAFEQSFGEQAAVAWLAGWGPWAGLAGVLLLIADLVLPIPASAVMAALGILYGPLAGGLLAFAGGFLSGTLAYLLCRALGRPAALRLLGPQGLAEGEQLFARAGGWLVVFSRWLPVLPEVVACMAGLARMPPAAFLTALACGSAPLGFAFAALGHAGATTPILAIALSAGLPPLLWLAVGPCLRARRGARAGFSRTGAGRPRGTTPPRARGTPPSLSRRPPCTGGR
jgi:uncharacterized membrane protein YdjX (TVP38/TMEM64 family)